MKLAQCKNGHYYNQEITQCCPVCGNSSKDGNITNVFLKNDFSQRTKPVDDDATVYLGNEQENEEMTVPMFEDDLDDMPTVGMPIAEEIWSPVVGWIVCTGHRKGGLI